MTEEEDEGGSLVTTSAKEVPAEKDSESSIDGRPDVTFVIDPKVRQAGGAKPSEAASVLTVPR